MHVWLPFGIMPYSMSPIDTMTIVEAALATSAATTFFKSVTIGVRKYVDGALGSNNPVEYVWNEAQSKWCPDDGQIESMLHIYRNGKS